MKMVFVVNNGRKLEVSQSCEDGPAHVVTKDSSGNAENVENISPGDFVTLLNWYRSQKNNGNVNLTF
jgi:hypothetical protein